MTTLLTHLCATLRDCVKTPDGLARPAAILWPDPKGEWQPLLPALRQLMPELLAMGTYAPSDRTGPAVWLRCAVDRALPVPGLEKGMVPVLYLPNVSRADLRAGEECPWLIQPLVELQYRGALFQHHAGHDWTVSAYLTGPAQCQIEKRDVATMNALLRALPEVAKRPLAQLQGRGLRVEDFDGLLTEDFPRDFLLWIGQPEATRTRLGEKGFDALCSQAQGRLKFDPKKLGPTEAARRLADAEGEFAPLWTRFAQSPTAFPELKKALALVQSNLLTSDRSHWPHINAEMEAGLQSELLKLPRLNPELARLRLLELETEHAPRRKWVWALLGDAPLAQALEPLARMANQVKETLAGQTARDLGKAYFNGGHEVDACLWEAFADARPAHKPALAAAAQALYAPWAEAQALRLQGLLKNERPQPEKPYAPEPGCCVLFVDGLRMDVGMKLAQHLQRVGHPVDEGFRMAALPTVTATAKPACTPVRDQVRGETLGEDFQPALGGKPADAKTLREGMRARGAQILADLTEGPKNAQAWGWAETGTLDKQGHDLQAGLLERIPALIEEVAHQVQQLLETGWHEVLVVTDHGWLCLPQPLPKAEVPKHLVLSRWSRCALPHGHAHVDHPLYPWHWNPGEHFASPAGIGSFTSGACYAHGGVSLQEMVIPELRVRSGGRKKVVRTTLESLLWKGLRCAIITHGDAAGLKVDLRLDTPDGRSLCGGGKPLSDDGMASLLVADDQHLGARVVVVLLNADKHILDSKTTSVGAHS